MILSEALNQYLATISSDDPSPSEPSRYVRWAGLESSVEKLSPPNVAEYALTVSASGDDVRSRLTQLKQFLTFLNKLGLLKQSLSPHVKIPKVNKAPTALNSSGEATIILAATTHLNLTEELRGLKDYRTTIADKLREAAADKDFKENAPLDAAREEQGKLEARVREIEATLRSAIIAEPSSSSNGQVQMGSRVTLKDLSSGKQVFYTLVDSSEADPPSGKLSVSSPVGQAILGKSQGEEAQAVAPKGIIRYLVASVKD